MYPPPDKINRITFDLLALDNDIDDSCDRQAAKCVRLEHQAPLYGSAARFAVFQKEVITSFLLGQEKAKFDGEK